MAINIYSGNAPKGKSNVNKTSNLSRAQQAKAALVAPSETSASGSTAVKSKGVLSKVGNFIGKAAGVASKFLPGVGGMIAKGVKGIFNDPEWWSSVPGDAVTLNAPLRAINVNTGTSPSFTKWRAAIAEFVSGETDHSDGLNVVEPDTNMIVQYLMPEIRKVVNAIPLQDANAYQAVLTAQSNLYALWRQLKKVDYMLKHGTTYLASMNDSAFPICQVVNAAWLQSTINRLEEYLRSHVRLPHTLCEYLAWRFGRVYKSTNSAKSGLILYNVITLTSATSTYDQYIEAQMNIISGNVANQQANTDIYNAYYDHDFMVVIADDTQFKYDAKEFMLRINLTVGTPAAFNENNNPIHIDSELDNPTTFMASTVSTAAVASNPLFPVNKMKAYMPSPGLNTAGTYVVGSVTAGTPTISTTCRWEVPASGSSWIGLQYDGYDPTDTQPGNVQQLYTVLNLMTALKPLDIYNKGAYVAILGTTGDTVYTRTDLSTISMDMGLVRDEVLSVEQIYAFANLVDIKRKTSVSYAQAEKLVARDVADLTEKLDIATVTA